MSSARPATTTPLRRSRPRACLVLADGEVFEGEAIGALATGDQALIEGEVVFNTVLSGYQEVVTDPSYAGQVVCFTNPHIGNYGVNAADAEAAVPRCRGVVVRDLSERPSNWRSEGSLEDYLVHHGVGGVTGVDTRRLTRHLRRHGAMPCALGTGSQAELVAAARLAPPTDGRDLVSSVTTGRVYERGQGPYRVVAYDFGVKETMLRHLASFATVIVVPASTPAGEALDRRPDGVFLSNGPGDPGALPGIVAEIGALVGRVPIFGICLGHQLLATALGGRTEKLPFGHHGGNHPVKRLDTGQVEITAQNHNYAVAPGSVDRAAVTHVNLNDGVIEGISSDDARAFSVQYHPEAGPGPHDARYLFDRFRLLMDQGR